MRSYGEWIRNQKLYFHWKYFAESTTSGYIYATSTACMVFENSQIETSELPSVESVDFQKLAPAYRNVEYIGTAIFAAFLLIAVAVAFISVPDDYWWVKWAVLALWLLLFAGGMFLAGKQYQMAGYALREHDVVHKFGVWWQTVITVPFNRMQHCEISQGPVQSMFGLATLKVFTAGGTSSDLAIDGLLFEEAQRIKDFITNKISGSSERGDSPELASGGSEENSVSPSNFDQPPAPPTSAPTDYDDLIDLKPEP